MEEEKGKPLLLTDGAECMERSRLVLSDVYVEGVKQGPLLDCVSTRGGIGSIKNWRTGFP